MDDARTAAGEGGHSALYEEFFRTLLLVDRLFRFKISVELINFSHCVWNNASTCLKGEMIGQLIAVLFVLISRRVQRVGVRFYVIFWSIMSLY